ncbi:MULTISPECIES: hypothetical protein [Gammaproteobacteria]|uniref:Uncharacterized protein n=2 Tax=Vibrio harveyi TaxID=669 RepID=A0A8B3DGD7_VIBHA|nr:MULTISPECIES: hypothetical protein [Gammaproteobacteria]APP09281.1 hypothetical protein BG259_28845 [Vibrio harveyi]EKO3839392.1 hypothetical protein [Vibrio harveyi]KNY38644.1 hypothetical protein AKG94_26420 [Vibrio harveyi]QOI94951.1 hypothetical protein G7042_07335 [Aeromonas salmonicida subsp. masoucida]RCR62448.1 hypothetical protein DTW68_15240 [Vibrio harveyi]
MPISKKLHNLWSEIFIEPRKQKARRYEDIDPKITPLVSQLNAVPSIKTLASCQGHAFGRPEPPYVYFVAEQGAVERLIQAVRKARQRGKLHHPWEIVGQYNHDIQLVWALSSTYHDQYYLKSNVIDLAWHRDRIDDDIQTLTHIVRQLQKIL